MAAPSSNVSTLQLDMVERLPEGAEIVASRPASEAPSSPDTVNVEASTSLASTSEASTSQASTPAASSEKSHTRKRGQPTSIDKVVLLLERQENHAEKMAKKEYKLSKKTYFFIIALASAAFGHSVTTIGVPVTGLAAAPYVAPIVSTAVHHAPTLSEASRLTSFEAARPGVPHTVARVSSYTPAAIQTVHASVPTAVTGAVHVPGYTYLPRYSHRYDDAVAATPCVGPVVSTAVHQAPTMSEASRVTSFESARPGVPHTVAAVSSYPPAAIQTVHASVPTAVTGAVHVPGYTYLPRYSHRYDGAVAATPYVGPVVSTAVHQAPTASEASRVSSFETARPGVPHTVAAVSSYTRASLQTVHASVPTAVTGAVHVPGYTYLPRYSHRYDGAVADTPYVAPVVSTAVHQAPAVSEASRVTSFETSRPGVPHSVASVSSYTSAAVHGVHTTVPVAVTGGVHVAGYTYLPRYSRRVEPQPSRYSYTYGATQYGFSYGRRLDTVGYVGYSQKS
ncbi:adhesive plaque matrix protein-like [Dermacentor albipictus]|uniref:adhesive plaque matrix protein-like n=1 Tax=Dermacentor albipictus TaxID=60249 RepID=UPI0038FD1769